MTSFLKNPAFLVGLLAVIALLAIVIIAIAVILLLRSRKKGEQSEPEEIKTERPRIWFPASGMTGSFREAMRRLKERLPGWDYRYEAPWFVLVGESGSGKTTVANEFSGTSIETIEPLSIDCAPRWLLLDRAVLIDLPGKAFLSSEQPTNAPESTAPSFLGRVVPPAHELSDRDAWRSFLRATARYRPRQPLNGIVLTISAVKLLDIEADPDHQRNLAWIANLSDRLQDIQHLIGLSVPVYVLVTKCDVVNGFGFYSRRFIEDALSLRAEEDGGAGTEIGDDLFGWSNPHLLDSTFSPAWVDEAFDATTDALLRHQMKMLAESRTVAAADGVFVFPFELQRLQVPLRTLMNVLFRETAYHSPHLARYLLLRTRVGCRHRNRGYRWISIQRTPGSLRLFATKQQSDRLCPRSVRIQSLCRAIPGYSADSGLLLQQPFRVGGPDHGLCPWTSSLDRLDSRLESSRKPANRPHRSSVAIDCRRS
jgi:type VI protein secretion system component VasK